MHAFRQRSGLAVGFRGFLGSRRFGLLGLPEQAQKFLEVAGKSCNPRLVLAQKAVDFGQMLQCRGGWPSRFVSHGENETRCKQESCSEFPLAM